MSAPIFDARRIPSHILAGDARGNENAISIVFEPKTKAESDALWAALYAMEAAGLYRIETTPAPRTRTPAPRTRQNGEEAA